MLNKAYLSIEGKYVKAVITKKNIENAQFLEFHVDELLDFIKENSIKEVYMSVSFSELYTFKLSFPFQISEKKKILEKLVFNEIRKIYPNIQRFSFMYETYMADSRTWIRCYMIPESSYQFIEEFIEARVNIKALYPLHIPLIFLVNSVSELIEKNKIVCFFSGKSRFLFVFEKTEMILMREFEGSEDLTDEDIININMTMNYSIQNLRVIPNEVILIGVKKRELSGLSLPYRFLSILPEYEKYTVPLIMVLSGEDLKRKSILPEQYRRFKKTIKYLNYASFVFIITMIALFGYNLESFYKIKSIYSSMISQRQYVLEHEQEFFDIDKKIKKFETEMKPFIELQNKRNSMVDMRYLLKSIGQAKTEFIQIISVEILNAEKPELKIKGKSIGKSFSERQMSYLNFKASLHQGGFKIINESWDITKGELSIDAIYEHTRVLQ